MKLTPITVTALEITEADGLDSIRVFLEDKGPGQGRLIIECFGKAWSSYWEAMPGNCNLRHFITTAADDYLVNRLLSMRGCKEGEARYLRRIISTVQKTLLWEPEH